MDADGQLRNLRDFLLVYNRMTEICFQRCTSNFNYRTLTMDEERCVDNCAGKLIRTNHRLMGTYVQLMPAMVQKRMDEMEKKAAEMAKAESVASESSLAGTASAAEMPAAGEPEHHIVPMQSASNNTADVQTPTPDVSAVGDAYLHFEPAIKSPDVSQTFDNRTEK